MPRSTRCHSFGDMNWHMSPTFFIQWSDTYSCRKEAIMHIKQLNKKGKKYQSVSSRQTNTTCKKQSCTATSISPHASPSTSYSDQTLQWPPSVATAAARRCSDLTIVQQCQGRQMSRQRSARSQPMAVWPDQVRLKGNNGWSIRIETDNALTIRYFERLI